MGASAVGVGALVVVVLFMFRVLFATGFDPTLALIVVSHANVYQAMLASAVPFVAVLCLFLGTFIAYQAGRRSIAIGWRACLVLLALAVQFPLVAQTPGPWTIAAVLGVVIVAFAVIAGLAEAAGDKSVIGASSIIFANLVIAALISAQFVVAAPMWLPSEQLNVKNGPPIVGYVLDDRGTDVVVYSHSGRTVHRVPHTSVTMRRYCVERVPTRYDLVAYELWGTPKLTKCAKAP